MSRFLLCFLLVLSLTGLSSCSKKNDFYYSKRHTPSMNPGGEAFNSDPEFVKNYNIYLKNNTKRKVSSTPERTAQTLAKSNQSIEENIFLDAKNIYELPNATILPLVPFEPPGEYNSMPPPPLKRLSNERAVKAHRGGLFSYFRKKANPPPSSRQQVKNSDNYSEPSNYDYEPDCDLEENLYSPPFSHEDDANIHRSYPEPRPHKPLPHRAPKPVIPENTTGSPFLKKWHTEGGTKQTTKLPPLNNSLPYNE